MTTTRTKPRARTAKETPAPNGNTAPADDLAAAPTAIHLERLPRHVLEVPIEGVTPLIMHNWSEKSKRMMLDAQTSRTRAKKEPRDPEADYNAAFYRMEDGTPALPATAFKAAICDAARFFDGVTIVSLKAAVFVHGTGRQQLIPVVGEPEMREDTVRNQTGVADLRYRPEFWPWSAVLKVEYLPTMLTPESVLALVDAAGRNGVGDGRPSSPKSRSGTYGQFRVVDA